MAVIIPEETQASNILDKSYKIIVLNILKNIKKKWTKSQRKSGKLYVNKIKILTKRNYKKEPNRYSGIEIHNN